jgi:hypothetical protein
METFGPALGLAMWLGRYAPDGLHSQATVRLIVSRAPSQSDKA